jgi:hypothetical protein
MRKALEEILRLPKVQANGTIIFSLCLKKARRTWGEANSEALTLVAVSGVR